LKKPNFTIWQLSHVDADKKSAVPYGRDAPVSKVTVYAPVSVGVVVDVHVLVDVIGFLFLVAAPPGCASGEDL
jgi:hypothetical protein